MPTSYSSSNPYPPVLAHVESTFLNQPLLWWLPNIEISSSFLLHLLVVTLPYGRSFYSYLFVCFVCLYHSDGFLFYSMDLNLLLLLFIIMLKLLHTWPIGVSSSWLLTFTHVPIILWAFLVKDAPGLSFAFLAPILESTVSSRTPILF